MSVKDIIHEAATNPKVGVIAAGTTTTTGTATWLDWIPGDIGKIATLVGIVLSCVLILTHVQTYRKIRLEMEIMRQKEAERQDSVRFRKRRSTDKRID